jgi:hypothetical protein
MGDDLILWSERFGDADAECIGGKGTGLGWLHILGLEIPPGFCLTTRAFDRFARKNGVFPAALSGADGDRASLASVPGRILAGEMPVEVAAEVHAAISRLCGGEEPARLVVRSSFGTEDLRESLSAGQYLTLDDVPPPRVAEAVKQVWASAFSPSAVRYRQSRNLPVREACIAVVVQPYVQSVLGGVTSTLHPQTGDVALTIMESVEGSAAGLTSGERPCNRYLVSKTNDAIVHRQEPVPGARIPDALLRELVGGCKRVELLVDAAVDVEWCCPSPGRLVYLQARVIRVPEAAPRDLPVSCEAAEARLRSPKIRAAALRGGGEPTSHVIGPAAFAGFVPRRPIGAELARELTSVFEHYLSRGPVSIRPAYWSALQSGDMLPQSGRLRTVAECLQHLERYWSYIVDAGLDDYTAQVACLVSNWLPVYASATAVTDADEPDIVVIHALYGFLEGLEGNSHDVYVVSTEPAPRVVERRVAAKQAALYSRERGPEPVPEDAIRAPVLRDDEILAIGMLGNRAASPQGPIRIEVLVTEGRGPGAVVPWQIEESGGGFDARTSYSVQPYDERSSPPGVVRVGSAVFTRAGGALPDTSAVSSPIFILASEDRLMRDREWVADLAAAVRLSNGSVAFGGSILSHFATTLRGNGVAVFPVLQPVDHRIQPGARVAIVTASA